MTTIIVHGTFARTRDWWRAGQPFPTAVGRGIESADCADDVWRVAGTPVAAIEALARQPGWSALRGRERLPFETSDGCFHWSSENSHTLRRDAGEQLAHYLATVHALAGDEVIDVIAHSHGGNVVKEATTHFTAPIVRRVALLGTPHFEFSDGSGHPYELNPHAIADSVVNLYSELDTVQVNAAQMAPDFGGPPGLPAVKALGFAGTLPPVDARRIDRDPGSSHLYENVEIPVDAGHGKKAHTALCDPEIGLRIGRWLALDQPFVDVWNSM